MRHKSLKRCKTNRPKALFGADGAIMAAATLAAAGMNVAATTAAAKSQSKAMVENAKTQAQSIKDQTLNNNNLQKEQLAFTRQQNQENRQQQQDIQTTLQLLAGQENMNDRMERGKMQVKLGGKPRRKLKSTPSYGGASFQVTDGGYALPVATYNDGGTLYELIGNDHEHYHKTKGGKYKSGVGIKTNNGTFIEGEGNQNTEQGEYVYDNHQDLLFVSKNDIDGFIPTEAVNQGIHPVQAFNIQQYLKTINGLNDDGSKTKRRSIKKLMGGLSPVIEQANLTQNPINGTVGVSSGMAYAVNNVIPSAPPVEDRVKAKCGKRVKSKCGKRVTLKCGGRRKAAWGDYAGATYASVGNVLGAGITTLGSLWAANRLGKAYRQAGSILSDAYSRMKGIDLSELKREDYEAPHTLAVVRTPNTNINPQLERIRRDAAYERKEVNRGTLSSAARQQRLAAINDRMMQRSSEQYAYKDNLDEQIKQGNAERITQTAQANADRDVQARRDYTGARMSLLQYNNNIENAKITGMAQAQADAMTQGSLVKAQALQNSFNAFGSAIGASGNAFANAYDAARTERTNFTNSYIGLGDDKQVKAAILRAEQTGDMSFVRSLAKDYQNKTDRASVEHYETLVDYLNNKGITVPRRIGYARRGSLASFIPSVTFFPINRKFIHSKLEDKNRSKAYEIIQ